MEDTKKPRVRYCFMRRSVDRLNLIYHACPLAANDTWRANVRQLKLRLHIFNGAKHVAIVAGDGLLQPDVVMREFADDSINYHVMPNDRELRETVTFLPLLEAVASDNPLEASWYGHTKGNSTADDPVGAELWRNSMYHHLLDHHFVCRDLLLRHPCVGTHKMVFPMDHDVLHVPYPTRLKHGNWMFAGTFFWFRHDAVFGHDRWRDVPRDRYGAEAWLSGLFAADDAATVFQPWPANEYPPPNPYDPRVYKWPIRDP